MERQILVEQIQSIIQKHGNIHCYENIIGNSMLPNQIYEKTAHGVFYDDGSKRGFIQGFHGNHVTVVFYRDAKPIDTFSMSYYSLSVKYLTECLNFLKRN